jgi:hypothetical protein
MQAWVGPLLACWVPGSDAAAAFLQGCDCRPQSSQKHRFLFAPCFSPRQRDTHEVCPLRYDRQRCEAKTIKDMQLLAAMAPPGGGRNAFSQRVMAMFSTVNMTQPSDGQLRRIFGAILHTKLFNDEVGDFSHGGGVEWQYGRVASQL